MKKRIYLAYGSNLNVEQMKFRCPKAEILDTSYIEDYELLFKGSGSGSYLTIEKKEGSIVPVALWEVTPADERALDRYEGYPHFYYKQDFTGDDWSKAFAYIMHEDRKLGIPSEAYVGTCIEGYKYFGFEVKYLMDALMRSKEILK